MLANARERQQEQERFDTADIRTENNEEMLPV